MDSDNSIVCKYRKNGAMLSTSLPLLYSNTHSTKRIKSQDKTHAPKPGSQNILRRPIRFLLRTFSITISKTKFHNVSGSGILSRPQGFLWSKSPVMKSSTVSRYSSLPRSGGLEVRPEKPLPSTPQLPDPKKTPTPPTPHCHTPVVLLYKFLVEYTPIMSVEHRQIYKEDFDREFSEYQTPLPVLESESRKFSQLEQKLLQEEKNSEGYKKIINQILHEYQESKRDVKQTEARKRFHYLHKKLTHIKWLVLDYDAAYLS